MKVSVRFATSVLCCSCLATVLPHPHAASAGNLICMLGKAGQDASFHNKLTFPLFKKDVYDFVLGANKIIDFAASSSVCVLQQCDSCCLLWLAQRWQIICLLSFGIFYFPQSKKSPNFFNENLYILV
ncbi:unnamed protein product [Meganyctiphanes norvegica]|uniref:Uncharacterized protein n=1 Tax=Meganyctiphanes norvegica TaxID=48144 RepID=A0AAV2PR52_MEGNR